MSIVPVYMLNRTTHYNKHGIDPTEKVPLGADPAYTASLGHKKGKGQRGGGNVNGRSNTRPADNGQSSYMNINGAASISSYSHTHPKKSDIDVSETASQLLNLILGEKSKPANSGIAVKDIGQGTAEGMGGGLKDSYYHSSSGFSVRL